MKFFVLRNRDAADAYVSALRHNGFEETLVMDRADFLLFDYERGMKWKVPMEKFISEKPSFIYPHTPVSWFIWDSIYHPLPVKCNFVATEFAKESMQSYGYPYPVKAVGFSRCEIRPFTPTSGRNVLIVPPHVLGRGQYVSPTHVESMNKVIDFVMRNRSSFGNVTLCHNADVSKIPEAITLVRTNPYRDESPLFRMIERIKEADLVLSCNTTGAVSVALGKPTVFFAEQDKPISFPTPAAHAHLYLDRLRFPLAMETMMMSELLEVCKAEHPAVTRWKQDNIGVQFDPEKFITAVKECL